MSGAKKKVPTSFHMFGWPLIILSITESTRRGRYLTCTYLSYTDMYVHMYVLELTHCKIPTAGHVACASAGLTTLVSRGSPTANMIMLIIPYRHKTEGV